MKIVDSPRRQIVMAVLLGLAALGAVIRYWAPNPSTLRDVGTLMLVLWLPAVGNLIAFLVRKIPRRTRDFAPGAAFNAHVSVVFVPAIAQGHYPRCTLAVGNEGFTARLIVPPIDAAVQDVAVEFLRPALALPKFGLGTEFQLLVGPDTVGQGRVVKSQRNV